MKNMIKYGDLILHNKTGNVYIYEGRAIIEATMTPAILYRQNGSETAWVRPEEEFFDGRFQLLDPSSFKAGE